jgi:hypothetical protein
LWGTRARHAAANGLHHSHSNFVQRVWLQGRYLGRQECQSDRRVRLGPNDRPVAVAGSAVSVLLDLDREEAVYPATCVAVTGLPSSCRPHQAGQRSRTVRGGCRGLGAPLPQSSCLLWSCLSEVVVKCLRESVAAPRRSPHLVEHCESDVGNLFKCLSI